MRRLLIIALLLAGSATGCGAPQMTVRGLDELRAAPLYTFNAPELDLYLRWLSQQEGPLGERVAFLARKNIGQPYRPGLLGEFPFELYDADPMCCLAAGDCVTFVEQTYAMALSHDWASFFRMLQRLRYKDGRVGLITRNHFMETDWNVNNAWLFNDVTVSLGSGQFETMRVRIDRSALLGRYGVGVSLPLEIMEDSYIPRDRLPAALPDLQDGDIVEIVRGNVEWQWVGHVGLIGRDGAGRVMLIHSSAPRAREESLGGYIGGRADVLGIKVLRPKAPARHHPDLASDAEKQIVLKGL